MISRPTMAFFGSSIVSAYWNGAATYYRGIVRALSALGYRITFYEPDAYDRQQHRDIEDPEWAKVFVYRGDHKNGPLAALDHARGADVIIKASGVGVFDELLEAAVVASRRPGQLAVFWDVDAPATLERLTRDPGDPFHRCIPKFDLVLTYGGGDRVIHSYHGFGARCCVPIYNAHDPSSHYPVAPEDRFRSDLSLLANRLPDREERVHEFFVRPALELEGKRFVLGGNGWQDKALPPNVEWVGHVFTKDHNAFNASARAVLNVARDSMAKTGFSPATRVFEAAAAGACVITDDWDGIDSFFEPDTEILVARSGDDVADWVCALTDDRARAVGEAARKRVLTQHTYRDRATLVDSLISGRRLGSHQA